MEGEFNLDGFLWRNSKEKLEEFENFVIEWKNKMRVNFEKDKDLLQSFSILPDWDTKGKTIADLPRLRECINKVREYSDVSGRIYEKWNDIKLGILIFLNKFERDIELKEDVLLANASNTSSIKSKEGRKAYTRSQLQFLIKQLNLLVYLSDMAKSFEENIKLRYSNIRNAQKDIATHASIIKMQIDVKQFEDSRILG